MGCYAPYTVRNVTVIYALYTAESVGERNVDKIPAQQGSYLNKGDSGKQDSVITGIRRQFLFCCD